MDSSTSSLVAIYGYLTGIGAVPGGDSDGQSHAGLSSGNESRSHRCVRLSVEAKELLANDLEIAAMLIHFCRSSSSMVLSLLSSFLGNYPSDHTGIKDGLIHCPPKHLRELSGKCDSFTSTFLMTCDSYDTHNLPSDVQSYKAKPSLPPKEALKRSRQNFLFAKSKILNARCIYLPRCQLHRMFLSPSRQDHTTSRCKGIRALYERNQDERKTKTIQSYPVPSHSFRSFISFATNGRASASFQSISRWPDSDDQGS